jgi:hypothetical protein
MPGVVFRYRDSVYVRARSLLVLTGNYNQYIKGQYLEIVYLEMTTTHPQPPSG